MIARQKLEERLRTALRRSRVVSLIGPRQCGKTTLARNIVPPGDPNYFDLEDPIGLARLGEPMTGLAGLTGTVVIDEIQRDPAIFPILRVLADRTPLPARFLILGSASPTLVRHASESLAGRIETIRMSGFDLSEIGADSLDAHWLRGGFPPSFLASEEEESFVWRLDFQQTFVERDVPLLGYDLPAAALLRFWSMLAHYHGNIWNASEFARSLGTSEATVRRYLDILSGFFMIRQLLPWHENLKKRQVKAPKVYVRDSGMLHALLGIRTQAELLTHPKLGASWEGYVVEEVIKTVRTDEVYFWATHQGAELDMLILKDGRKIGVEIKRQDAPRITPSMRIAMEDLRLDKLSVIYPGDRPYPLSEEITVYPVASLAEGGGHLL